ncbi:MAG: DEAD/DEAH box helicase [Clostridia bacterium]|nr:DEAD/DEAH box helicase [Clostridia bacterium]
MKYQPHDYQNYATQFIIDHPVAAILLQMGLGKSVITLTAIQQLLASGSVHKVLVIGPLRVARDTWPAEIEKWDHLSRLEYSVAVGTESERRAALMLDVPIHIINRENVQWLIESSHIPFEYDMIVIDELSSFKNHQAKRFKSLMKQRHRVSRVVGLTGTPSSNGLMDLFAEYKLLDMGKRLGRFITQYRQDFFVPDKCGYDRVYSWKPRPGAEQEIYRRIGDITVSMKSVDFLKMPECIINRVPVAMDCNERDLYDEMKTELVLSLGDDIIDAKNAAALSGKLTQMSNGAVYSEAGDAIRLHDRKLDALEDLIEAANGNPVLVAYWYQHDIQRIQERFPKVRTLRTSRDIANWNAGKIPVAAIHPASAGHGLNLQAGGSTLVWFGLTWSLELYQQTNARLWRQGQQAETVVIHHIITTDTIDEQIMDALERKDRTQAALIDAVRAQLGV